VRTDQLFRHQNHSNRDEYGQINGEMNLNNKSEHEKSVCQNGHKDSASF
jgi:hypothetical protein